jgi:hypothetical protein
VTRGVDDVDLIFLFGGLVGIEDGGILGEDSDTAFFFLRIGIHHARFHVLVLAECSGLFQ